MSDRICLSLNVYTWILNHRPLMKRLLTFLFCASAILLFGCNTTPDPVLTVTPENLAFSAEGGAQTVQVKANNPWTASASGSGISVNPSSGEGDATVTVTTSATSSTNPVSGTVVFRSEGLSATVSVTQDERKVIQVGNVMVIPAEGGTFAVTIQYNTEYRVEVEASAKSWISFLGTRALQSGKLEFQFAENGNTEPRQGKVTVKDKSGKVSDITLTFVQEEKKVIDVGGLMTIPAEGGTFAFDIQYNTDFDVIVESGAQSWITFVATRALKSGKLEFQFAENQNTDPRQGKVTVKDKSEKVSDITLNFVQEKKKVITVGDVMPIPAEGGTFMVDIQYNTDFDVFVESGAQSWIHFVAVRSLTSGKLEFSFDAIPYPDVRTGKVRVKDKSGKVSDIKLTFTQDGSLGIKNALMEIYDAMDGPNWRIDKKWDMSRSLFDWQGIIWDHNRSGLLLYLGNYGLKGEFPDCFDDLTDLIGFTVDNEPGVTGTLPPSFGRLKNLTGLSLHSTSMTSLPDLFEGVPLWDVIISDNTLMAGPLPETLGSNPGLEHMALERNAFTGMVPDSWACLGTKLYLREPFLDEKVPDSFVTSPDADWLVNMYLHQADYRTTPLVVGDYDIPAYWPRRDIKDLVTGKTIAYKEIVSRNKATVLLNWATWCPFSKTLLPILKRMYDKYHDDGLEIIAAFNADSPTEDSGKPLKDVLLERNYDSWYNFSLYDFDGYEWNVWCSGTPSAIVVDRNGNVIKASRGNITDHSRNRFGYKASIHLIPVLEEIFGPLEENEDYASTDYSKDGEVMTLQKATVGNGINIVFLGDAYVDRDMNSGGLYETLMRQSMEEFFSIEPYKTFRNRFNVYAVKVVSKNEKTGPGYSTAIGSVATYSSISTGSADKCFEYALKVPEIKDKKNLLIGVLVNSVSERGITSMSESLQSGIAYYGSTRNASEAFGITLRHEAGGHGFAFLDDEYGHYNEQIPQAHIDNRNSMYQKYGWYSNVDFTNDPSKVKWSVFLSDERYKNEVGIFEGGSLYSKGAYRPSENSMMRSNYEYFNAPSRWAIYKRIMELSGETASFDKFLEYDAVNRSSASAAPRPPLKAAAAPKRSTVHSAPPVVIK